MAAVVTVAAMGLASAPAQGATSVYPGGGSTFSGGPEGWTTPEEPTCTIPLTGVCSATAGYDGSTGNPAGSLTLDTEILVNVLGLLSSSAVFESPDFAATQGGSGTISLERAVASTGLLDLTPTVDYEVTLLDRTNSTSSVVLSGTATGAEVTFAGQSGAVSLVQGHTYALSMTVGASSEIASLGLSGGTAASFDNIAVTVGSSDDGGGGGGGGGGGSGSGGDTLTNSELKQLIQSSGLVGPATLKGNKITVKAKCPKQVGRACRVTLQGFLKKGKAATNKRSATVAQGKTKRIVLTVKPKLKSKVQARKKLLFKLSVRAGSAKATVFKSLKLVRR